MSCGQVATNMNNLVAMRSSCPRPQATGNKSKKDNDDKYFTGVEILKPGPHDVLLGRGGGTNNHGGNIQFRKLVNEHKMRYLSCSKLEKPTVAREVVALWRKMDPPGRFLARKDEGKKPIPSGKRDEHTIWLEVGDKRAREKASQCLRERTADVVPYIQQIHAQNDHMTAEGVSMVSQQLRMQQEAQNQGLDSYDNGTSSAAFARRMSTGMPDQPRHGGDFSNRRGSLPMEQTSSSNIPVQHHGGDFSNRRGSLPMHQASSSNIPVQEQTFGRRLSAPHLQGRQEQQQYGDPTEIAMMQAQAQQAHAQMQMQQQMGAGQYGMVEPGMVPSNPAATMYGECNPAFAQQLQFQQLQQQQQMQLQAEAQAIEYQRQIMLEQQQQQQQHHMRMQREYSQQQQQQEWNMQQMQRHSGHQQRGVDPLGHNGSLHGGSHHGSLHGSLHGSSHHGQHRVPDQNLSRGANNNNNNNGASDDFDPLPLAAVSADIPQQRQQQQQEQNRNIQQSNNSKNSQEKRQRQPEPSLQQQQQQQQPRKAAPASPKKKKESQAPRKPHRPNKENNDADEEHAPLPLNATHDDVNGELTLEEYRKTLANYFVSNNIQPVEEKQDPPAHRAGAGGGVEDDEVSVESLTEWTEDVTQEHEKLENSNKEMDNSNVSQDNIDTSNPRRRSKAGRAPPSIRRVNRHQSGTSMMSMKSLKSTGTTLSGLSMLSDMSMDTNKEGKMSDARGHSSNASIMSELTDISQCIDDLTLDDE